MNKLGPLRFSPLFRRYLWGGRRLGELLGKPIGDGSDYAESWEAVDHGADQSEVLAGPCQGMTLGRLLAERPDELLGPHRAVVPQGRANPGEPSRPLFPLLFKFLDAHSDLSVQVHPDDAQAARQVPPDLGKTEAWVVLHADPGARIYAGLKRGFDRAALEREVSRGTVELCLHSIQPRPGDCLFVPAGVVHALGAGLVVAEIQQSSDTTFRLFDWNRVDKHGRRRPLHVEEAMKVIDFQAGPITVRTPEPLADGGERLVACDKFVLERRRSHARRNLSPAERFHLLVVLSGRLLVEGDPAGAPMQTGDVLLVPASAAPEVRLEPDSAAEWLDIYLPDVLVERPAPAGSA